jgi:hypothetical protein
MKMKKKNYFILNKCLNSNIAFIGVWTPTS